MRTGQNFWLLYAMLAIIQTVICNYFQFTPYAMVTLLPAMVLCIPLQTSTSASMVIAFATGLLVDWLSEGLIGINAAALVPVALARKAVIRTFIGEDLIARKDSFTFHKNGIRKISLALSANLTIFLVIYILLDGAGTRPVWFSLAQFGISLAINMILSLIVASILTPEEKR